jgi:hypothetical protein
MRRVLCLALVAGVAASMAPADASAASLRGSPAAMQEQNRVAKDHGLDFYATATQIHEAVVRGDLAELTGNADYEVADFVSFPYLQPAVKLFVERLASQYHAACGQKLVVTSAVRPSSGQPRNAHALSVHPAGMAVDLRVSDRASCRDWLESSLLGLERNGVINGIREFHPPHYHVAVYPEQYLAYVAPLLEEERLAAEAAERERKLAAAAALAATPGVVALLGDDARSGVAEVSEADSRGPLSARIMMLLAIPVGIGLLFRRLRSRA